MVGHRRDQLGGRVAVRRVQDRGAVHRAHHRQVLQSHLRRTVLADRYPGVRAAEAQVRAADRGHPDEVVGAGEERSEGRRERRLPQGLEADRRAEHVLLADVHLEIAVRRDLLEILGVGRVPDFAVEDHDVGPGRQRG